MIQATPHLSEGKLLAQLEEAYANIEVGSTYAHYRGDRYQVLGLVIIDATQEPAVLYKKLSGSDVLQSFVWVRPVQSWLESVQVESGTVPRFSKVSQD